MAGICPTEGLEEIAQEVIDNVSTNRGTGLLLGLYQNSSISAGTTYAGLTIPGGGYQGNKTLVDATWTGTGGSRTYAQQTFTATGAAFTGGAVYGYFIATNGTAKKIIAIEEDPNGSAPYTMGENDTYKVTPTITFTP